MGKIAAVCMSEKKGTAKKDAGQAEIIEQYGLKGDAHAGPGIKQVSLLSLEKIEQFRSSGDAACCAGYAESCCANIEYGAFGENLVVDGIDLSSLPVGTKLRSGEVLLEMSKIGKECHNYCEIYKRMGDCIMPREGVFAIVLHGGKIKNGDEIYVE
jgi:TatD DNase family protein